MFRDVENEFERIREEYFSSIEFDSESLLSGKNFDLKESVYKIIGGTLKGLGSLIRTITSYIKKRTKYATQFLLNLTRKYEHIIRLGKVFDRDIKLNKSGENYARKHFPIYYLASIPPSPLNGIENAYKFFFRLSALRVEKELGIKVKEDRATSSKVDGNDEILLLIQNGDIAIEKDLGKISYVIDINDSRVNVLTLIDKRPQLLKGGIVSKVEKSIRITEFKAETINSMINSSIAYTKLYNSKIKSIISTMVSIQNIIEDIDNSEVDDEALKMELLKDMEVLLKSGDIILDYIDRELSNVFWFYNWLLKEDANEDLERRKKEVNE